MSAFAFGQSDVVVRLEPARPRPGLKPMVRTVYSRFGRVKERTVQEVCDAVKGDVVYFRFGPAECVVPVHSWRTLAYAGSDCGPGKLAEFADMLADANRASVPVTVFGADRVEWRLSLVNLRQSQTRDALDMEADSPGEARLGSGSPVAAPGAMRREF